MKIDAGFEGQFSDIPDLAQRLEKNEAFHGVWVSDTTNDPFLLSCEFARQTERLTVGTNIAVAFARSPYSLAQTAYNLSQLSQGRFILGLGTQVRAHIRKRFSMEWPDKPVKALKEYIRLLRHLFASFQTRERPKFEGEYFQCTLNSPVFTPDHHEYPHPPIGMAAVGPSLTRAAGELAEVLFLHPFTHLKYIEKVSLPALAEGKKKRSNDLKKLSVVGSTFCLATDSDDYPMKRQEVLGRLAFYASTPNYRKVVESLGMEEDLHTQLHQLSRQGMWKEMAMALPPEFIDACVVQGPKEQLLDLISQRFSHCYDRVVVDPTPFL